MDTGSEGTEFDWDGGNAEKNWQRHRVSQAECEQVFFNRPLVVTADELHSDSELRFFALGQTDMAASCSSSTPFAANEFGSSRRAT